MAHAPGTKLESISTVKDGFIVPFGLREFALKNGVPLTKLMEKVGTPSMNAHNWIVQLKGHVPLSIAKALMLRWQPNEIPMWLSEIQGKVKYKKPACRITPDCEKITLEFDAKHVGTKIRTEDGSIITIASAAAEALQLLQARDAEARARAEAAAEEDRQRKADESLQKQLTEERIEAQRRAFTTQRMEVPAPNGGTIVIEMPAQVPAGEREIYTGLLIRLHHRCAVLEREKLSMQMTITGLEGQVSNLKDTMRRMSTERGEEKRLFDAADIKNAGTAQALATPRNATKQDFDAAKAQLKSVPELQSLVTDLEKGIKSFPEGRPLVS